MKRQPQEVVVLPAMEVVAAEERAVAVAATARADLRSSSSRVAKGVLSVVSSVGTFAFCNYISRTRTKPPTPSTNTISTPSSPKW